MQGSARILGSILFRRYANGLSPLLLSDIQSHSRSQVQFMQCSCVIAPCGFLEMQSKLFWTIFIILSIVADICLPLLWGLLASLPIAIFSWWIVYRSDWF